MNDLLNKVRKPEKLSLSKNVLHSALILVAGIILGVVSKMLDTTAINALPRLLQVLDLGNFLSRIGVWIFLGVVISVYSKSPIRACINVFLFFAGMVGSYYFYTVTVAGFFPKFYMMIWVYLTIFSPIFAFTCWYAKGKGFIAIIISSLIFMFITSQAFVFGFWYFGVTYFTELLIWVATIFVLYRSPKQIISVVSIGMILFFIVSPLLYRVSFFGF